VRFVLVCLVWLLVAIAAGASGATSKLRPPTPQLVILALTAALVIAGRAIGTFRRWLSRLDWRVVVSVHLTRFVGFAFLWLYARGELPYAFAVPGGVGDVLVAALALGLLVFSNAVAQRPQLLLAWNLLGLADILFVVLTAARLALADPQSMAALLRFPLSLVPTFLVPLIIASHVLLFVRLRGRERGAVYEVPPA
jgi:hypothetical protein